MSIYKELNSYIEKSIYPFHMPGHKRNKKYLNFSKPIINYDITEFGNMDNLHAPESIINDVNIRFSNLFNSNQSFIMVNGSSGGIIASIMSICKDGDTILIARNCHKSVFNGLIYSGAFPKYIYPSITNEGLVGGVNVKDIKEELEKDKSIKGVLITSPTYEGFTSDIEEISNLVHAYGKILIVDEAHGAHFKFSNIFPKTALQQGADIVIQSLHKTLPSLTQSAVLHVKGNKVNIDRLKNNLSLIQTTSPSYIVMSSMDLCLNFLENEYKHEFEIYVNRLLNFRSSISHLKNISIIGNEIKNKNYINNIDISKLVFYISKNKSGKEIDKILCEEYKVQIELSSSLHILALTSVADNCRGFKLLNKAINSLDKKIENLDNREYSVFNYPMSVVSLSPRQALNLEVEKIPINKCENRIAGQFITPYPPGIPLITPGEVITQEIIELIQKIKTVKEIQVIK